MAVTARRSIGLDDAENRAGGARLAVLPFSPSLTRPLVAI